MSTLHSAATAPPRDWPHYGISFPGAVKRGFVKSLTFSGRASRSEFLWFCLFGLIAYAVPAVIAVIITVTTQQPRADGSRPVPSVAVALLIAGVVLLLASALAGISLTVRRLHDAGFTGLLWLLNFIPSVGSIVVFVLCVLPTSIQNASTYGPPPAALVYGGGSFPPGTMPAGAPTRNVTNS